MSGMNDSPSEAVEGEVLKDGRGGVRPNSGRKPGTLNQKTLNAMAIKREYQDRIRRNAEKLFNAQFSLATGTQMLFVIRTDSRGNRRKPEIVTDPEIISIFLETNEGMSGTLDGDPDSEYYFMTTRNPDSRTLTDMLDRAMGKPDVNLKLADDDEKIDRPLIIGEIKPRATDKTETTNSN